MPRILAVRDLKVHRGVVFSLVVEEFSLHQSEILGLVGNNGSGKTTLLLTILDFLKRASGDIEVLETTWESNEISIKRRIGAFLDETFLLNYMTVEEYFMWLQRVHALDKKITTCLIDKFLGILEIEYRESQLIRDLSQGNFVKVGLIGSLIHRPKLVIWDEPFAHLDPRSKSQLIELIDFFRSEFRAAFLISSHNIEELYSIVDSILVLERGRVIAWNAKGNLSREAINTMLGVTGRVSTLRCV